MLKIGVIGIYFIPITPILSLNLNNKMKIFFRYILSTFYSEFDLDIFSYNKFVVF